MVILALVIAVLIASWAIYLYKLKLNRQKGVTFLSAGRLNL